MEKLTFNQMELTEGGKFWGQHDFHCHETSMGTYCCWDYAVFWVDVSHNCGWSF